MSTDSRPHPNLILIGMPGSGKSTIGVLLAKRLGMDFVDTDVLIQVREGRTLQEILDKEGYEALRAVEEKVLLALDVKDAVVATGGSAVYSARAMQRLTDHGMVVFLDVPLAEIERRVKDLDTRGIAAPPGTVLAQLFAERRPLYLKYAQTAVQCGTMGMEEVAERVVEQFGGAGRSWL